MTGRLEARALKALCELLVVHTSTPRECHFAVWDGWGWQHPGAYQVLQFTPIGSPLAPIEYAPDEWQLDLAGPKFSLPGRDYYLFTGELRDAVRFGYWVTADWFEAQSPSIFWPADHAWCVATEIDLDSTLVGGTGALIADLTGMESIEVMPIDPDALGQDLINR